MKNALNAVGTVLGLLGVLASLAAGLARVTGHHHLIGFESLTLFNVGVGLMVAACLAKLQALTSA
jgi:hypothetical protein